MQLPASGSPSATPEVFISYRRSRIESVAPLVKAVERAGVHCFFDVNSIDPLDEFPARIREGIGQSLAMLIIWSRDYGDSSHCMDEFLLGWQYARQCSAEVGRRIWIVKTEPDVSFICAGELAAQNFLEFPDSNCDANWAERIRVRIDQLRPEGPMARENVSHVPRHGLRDKTPKFSGRQRELLRIHSALNRPRIGQAATVAVQTYGLGGIGKSELAIAYANDLANAYPGGIFWLSFADFDPSRLVDEHTARAAWQSALERALQSESPELVRRVLRNDVGLTLSPEEARQCIGNYLNDNKRFLWVLDNVPLLSPDDLRESVLRFWRAPAENGATLITTRDSRPAPGCVEIQLHVLGDEDGLRLLLRHWQEAHPVDVGSTILLQKKFPPEEQIEAARILVKQVGGHALALTLLGEQAKLVHDEFVGLLSQIEEQGRLKRIEAIAERLRQTLGEACGGIVATFASSIESTIRRQPAASEILALASVCVPNMAISVGTLREALVTIGSDDFSNALADLIRASLLRRVDGNGVLAVEIHPLLADVASHELIVDAHQRRLQLAEALKMRISAASDIREHPQIFIDVKQAHALSLLLNSAEGVWLALRVGQFESARGNLKAALAIEKHAEHIARECLGPDHPDTLNSMNNLAASLQNAGDLEGALKLQERVMTTRWRSLGSRHRETLVSRHNLASTLHLMGRFTEACAMEEKALKVMNDLLGPEHPDTLMFAHNFGHMLQEQGDFVGARKLQEGLLATAQRLLGPEHARTFACMNSLAITLRDQGDFAGARCLQEKALEARLRLFGNEHSDTLTSMNNLSGTLGDQGDIAGARALQEQVLETMSRCYGSDHPGTLAAMNNLAILIQKHGDLARARELLEHMLSVRLRLYGPAHPDTLTAMNILGDVLRDQGELNEAQAIQEKVLDTRRQLRGSEHPSTLTSMSNLAATLQAQGDLVRARALFDEVASARTRSLDPEHPDVLISLSNRALNLQQRGDLVSARALQEQLRSKMASVFGPEHSHTLTNLSNLSITLDCQAEFAEAEMLQSQVLEARKRRLEPYHFDTLKSMQILASVYMHLRKFAEARELQEKILEIRKMTLKEDHASILTSMNDLACIYMDQGDFPKARELQQQVLEVRLRILGPKHSDTIIAMGNLAATLKALERREESERLFLQAIALASDVLGVNHSTTKILISNHVSD